MGVLYSLFEFTSSTGSLISRLMPQFLRRISAFLTWYDISHLAVLVSLTDRSNSINLLRVRSVNS